MKKTRINKIWFIIFLTITFLVLFSSKSNAAVKLNLKVSKTTVAPNEKFTVTVSASGGAGYATVKVKNASIVSNSATVDLMLQSSGTVTCKANSSGTITVSASGVLADNNTEKDENVDASPKTVKIKSSSSSSSGGSSGSSSSKSSDATLKMLGVNPSKYDFSGFSKNKTTYNVKVPSSVNSLYTCNKRS